MQNTKKKILSLLLTVALVVSLMPCITLTAWAATKTFDVSLDDANITTAGDYVITGSSNSNTITVQSGILGDVNITLSGVVIIVSGTSGACAFSIGTGSTVNLTLTEGNVLTSGNNCAGLQAPDGATLNIMAASTGSLEATGGSNAAGIGGGAGSNGADNSGGSATSGGNGSTGGTITISGGTVTAYGYNGAGIGGGCGGTGGTGSVGGNGGSGGSGGNITINGGTVTAAGYNGGAGIGGGSGNSGGISSGSYSMGGSGGSGGSGGTITISGGVVTAYGSSAGIGGGGSGKGGNSYYYYGGNGGSGGSGGTVYVSSGTVVASGSTADIGKGDGSSGGVSCDEEYGDTHDHKPGSAGSNGSDAALYISGGSVNADISYSVHPSASNPSYLYKTIVSGFPPNKNLSYTVDGDGQFFSKTDSNGCLYLWHTVGGCVVRASNSSGLYEASGAINGYINVITAYSLSTSLSALSVSDKDSHPLSLSSSFDKGIVAYSVDTTGTSVTSIIIAVTLCDSKSSLNINGLPVYVNVNGTASSTVALTNGANLIPVTVTSKDGLSQKSYILSVNGTVSNADLNSLTLSADSLSFDKDTTAYSVSVGSDVTSINLTASASDSKAIMLVNGAILSQGGTRGVNLSVGENKIELMVIAQNAATKTYTITVNRGISDATLSALALSAGTLSPSFGSGTYSYTASVTHSTENLTVTPTANDSNATVTVNGGDDTTPVALSVGSNTITIVVTGKDGVTKKTYTVTVTRQPAITITTESLPIGIVGASYSKTLSASGGSGSYTWSWEAASGSALPSGLELSTAGVLSVSSGGKLTGADIGSYELKLTVTDSGDASVTQTHTFTLKINKGCGNGAYLIESDGDTAYTGSYTDDGIPILTVSTGVSGFKYFSVNISAVSGHIGSEVCLFVHMRNGQQLGINASKGNFDALGSATAAFNVKAGDVIKVYIVDALTNAAGSSPTVL